MKPRVKGRFTFQAAGVLFMLTALVELFSMHSPVPLLGRLRGGGSAAGYHLIYALLFFWLGLGLLKAKPWGYRLVFAATGLYTLDRMAFVLDRRAMAVYLHAVLRKYGAPLDLPETGLIFNVVLLATVVTVACWWAFAGYTYLRRQYFLGPPESAAVS